MFTVVMVRVMVVVMSVLLAMLAWVNLVLTSLVKVAVLLPRLSIAIRVFCLWKRRVAVVFRFEVLLAMTVWVPDRLTRLFRKRMHA